MAGRREKVAREGLAEWPGPLPLQPLGSVDGRIPDSQTHIPHRLSPISRIQQVVWNWWSREPGLGGRFCRPLASRWCSLLTFPAYTRLSSAKLGPSGNV